MNNLDRSIIFGLFAICSVASGFFVEFLNREADEIKAEMKELKIVNEFYQTCFLDNFEVHNPNTINIYERPRLPESEN